MKIELKDIEWYKYHGALLPKIEPHNNIFLSSKDKNILLKQSKAFFLRYTNEWNRSESEFWYIVKNDFKGLDELSSNTRSKVRRGLKNCEVKKVSYLDIIENGYDVYSSAMKNYKDNILILSQIEFKKNKVYNNEYDIWAVYEKITGKMIAYSSNKIQNNIANYTEIKFHPKYQKLYSSYALFYEMNRYYLENNNFLYVHDGTRSIAHNTNIHQFLIEKFKFKKIYCNLVLDYRWDIKLLVNLLYPFKFLIKKCNLNICKKLAILLEQERIRRSFD